MTKETIGVGQTPNDGRGDYLLLAGNKINNNFDDLYRGRAVVTDFGATGDGATDDLAAIQECIDWAYANSIATVYMPAGNYRTSDTIYLDPPHNARVNWANPPDSQFTLRLVGDGFGGGDAPGTNIYTDGGFDGLTVGPGQYMGVKGVNIIGQAGARRSDFTDMGIRVLCAGGGAHGTNIEDCQIFYFHTGIGIGGNMDALGDSNVIQRCQISMCTIGVWYVASQQFINAIKDCTIQNCKNGVLSNYNLHVEITGGNFSLWDGRATAIEFEAVPGWTYTSFSDDAQLAGFTNWHFPVNATSDHFFMTEYDIFCIKSETLGMVALRKHSWDPDDPGVLELKFDYGWCQSMFGSRPTLEQLEWAAFTLMIDAGSPGYLYGGEYVTTFASAGIHARGVHVENFNSVTRIINALDGWQVGIESRMEDIYINYDPNFGSYASEPIDSDNYALYALAQVFPTVEKGFSTGLAMDNCNIAGLWRIAGESRFGSSDPRRRGYFTRNNAARISGIDAQQYFDGEQTNDFGKWLETPYRGNSVRDRGQQNSPFVFGDLSTSYTPMHTSGLATSPWVGHMPAPWVTPRMTLSMLDRLTGTLPDMFGTYPPADADTYPPICGDTIYSLSSARELDPRDLFVKFHHLGWSYGQDIPGALLSWEHIGPAPLIRFTGNGTKYLFEGLVFTLDYDGDQGLTTMTYMIRDVGYDGMTRVIPVIGAFWPVNEFTFDHTFSGTGIIQAPFEVTKIGNLKADALADSHIAGKRFYVGDIIWQKTPVGSGSMGWVCSTAGVAGVDAVFKTMPNLGA